MSKKTLEIPNGASFVTFDDRGMLKDVQKLSRQQQRRLERDREKEMARIMKEIERQGD